MPFETLPEFPQGREVTAMSSVAGIPPESFQQALRDVGVDLIESTKRPEDMPAVNAVLEGQVDTLAGQMGLQQPQPAASQAPVVPETPPAAPHMSPQAPPGAAGPTPADTFEARIQRVMEKYSSPREIAKAYVHTDQARTRAQQDRAQEIAELRRELDEIKQQRISYPSYPSYSPPPVATAPGPEYPPAPAFQAPPGVRSVPNDPEEFFKDPKTNFGQVVRDVVKAEIDRYSEDQQIRQQEMVFEQKRAMRAKEIDVLRPIMSEIYMRDQDLYEGLPKDRALDLLLERANERAEAIRGRAFFQEIREAFGPDGTPAPGHAAPGQTGALPHPGAGLRRAGSSPGVADWSNTPSFNRLWKSRSESYDEHRTIMDILKERGFGEDIR